VRTQSVVAARCRADFWASTAFTRALGWVESCASLNNPSQYSGFVCGAASAQGMTISIATENSATAYFA